MGGSRIGHVHLLQRVCLGGIGAHRERNVPEVVDRACLPGVVKLKLLGGISGVVHHDAEGGYVFVKIVFGAVAHVIAVALQNKAVLFVGLHGTYHEGTAAHDGAVFLCPVGVDLYNVLAQRVKRRAAQRGQERIHIRVTLKLDFHIQVVHNRNAEMILAGVARDDFPCIFDVAEHCHRRVRNIGFEQAPESELHVVGGNRNSVRPVGGFQGQQQGVFALLLVFGVFVAVYQRFFGLSVLIRFEKTDKQQVHYPKRLCVIKCFQRIHVINRFGQIHPDVCAFIVVPMRATCKAEHDGCQTQKQCRNALDHLDFLLWKGHYGFTP